MAYGFEIPTTYHVTYLVRSDPSSLISGAETVQNFSKWELGVRMVRVFDVPCLSQSVGLQYLQSVSIADIGDLVATICHDCHLIIRHQDAL